MRPDFRIPVRINLNRASDDQVTLLSGSSPSGETRPSNALGYPMVMPLKLKIKGDNEFWILPVEPLVSISGGNVVAKRNVAKGKGRGTIKERWSRDDFSITIEGILINYDDLNVYPEEDVKKLRAYCEAKEAIAVECDLLSHFDINWIVIEKFDFPFTKGENNQRYTINAVSDDQVNLLDKDDSTSDSLAPTTPPEATFENA